MANGTGSVDGQDEPAVVYGAGERRTHAEHAAEAYDLAARADALRAMAGRPDRARPDHAATAAVCDLRAQWHATMAIYESLETFAR